MRKLLPIILVIAAAAGVFYAVSNRETRVSRKLMGPALRVSFLTAELGGAVVLRTPEKRFVVVDPGPEECADDLAGYLSGAGAKSVTVVLTNQTRERAGALSKLSESLNVTRVIRGESGRGSIEERGQEQGKPAPAELILSAGDAVGLSKTVRLQVLSPPRGLLKGVPDDSDENSLVIRIAIGGTKFLLLSDAGPIAESKMAPGDAACTVLAAGRHGAEDGTSLELLPEAGAAYYVISAGGQFGRPDRALLERVSTANTGAAVYRTDRDGTVTVTTDGRTTEVDTEGSGDE